MLNILHQYNTQTTNHSLYIRVEKYDEIIKYMLFFNLFSPEISAPIWHGDGKTEKKMHKLFWVHWSRPVNN